MITKEITSLQHPIVKHLVNLRKVRSYREEKKSLLIAGIKIVVEVGSKIPLKALFLEKGVKIPSGISCSTLYLVTEEIFKKVTGLQSPELIAAEVAFPPPANLEGKQFLLALDGISDPGNLGTLLRSCLALKWDGVFLTKNTTDPFNEKALRAAKGATFHLPMRSGTWDELDALIQKNHLKAFVADIKGKSLETFSKTIRPPLLLVLGNESHGASIEARNQCIPLMIPMSDQMDSLNVASAGAIFLHTLRSSL